MKEALVRWLELGPLSSGSASSMALDWWSMASFLLMALGCYGMAAAVYISSRKHGGGMLPLLALSLLAAGTVFLVLPFMPQVPVTGVIVTGQMLAGLVLAAVAWLWWRKGAYPRPETEELQQVIRRLEHEVTERKRAEAALQHSQEQLRQLAAHQERVKEDERKRIAREIHDELGQNLMALRIDLSMLQASISGEEPVLAEKADLALTHIDASIRAVRSIINNLRPSALDLGLLAAIEWQVHEFQRRTGISCTMTLDECDIELDETRATALFRILQESLTNVARHAQATSVDIALRRQGDRLYMTVSDNGVGFYPGCRRKPNSFGLLGIGERISTLGGEFNVLSGPGPGTVLSLSIPINAQVSAA